MYERSQVFLTLRSIRTPKLIWNKSCVLALFLKAYIITDILPHAPIQSKSFTIKGLIRNTCLYWTDYCLLDNSVTFFLKLIPKSKNNNARITCRKYTVIFISSLSCSDYIVQLDWLRPKWTEYFTMQICQKIYWIFVPCSF